MKIIVRPYILVVQVCVVRRGLIMNGVAQQFMDGVRIVNSAKGINVHGEFVLLKVRTYCIRETRTGCEYLVMDSKFDGSGGGLYFGAKHTVKVVCSAWYKKQNPPGCRKGLYSH